MITVKVLVRSSVKRNVGIVCYELRHNRYVKRMDSSLRVELSKWDMNSGRLIANGLDTMISQGRIDAELSMLWKILRDLEAKNMRFSLKEVEDKFRSTLCSSSLTGFMKKQIDILKASHKFGTARNYEKTLCSFLTFLQGKDILLPMLTEELVGYYNAFLCCRGIVRNSISFYMRVLRAVYNKAVRLHLVEDTRPFSYVYTGIDRTRKRAVAENVLEQLYRLKIPKYSNLMLYRDIFIFSYCTRGMAFVDIVFLKKRNIQDGFICYTRRKTGQKLFVKIEKSIYQIIDRYASEDREYLFPIIKSEEVNMAYNQYRIALNTYNHYLAKLSDLLSMDCRLTSYTARHTWATTARNHNVPISIISAGLGHSNEQTTTIYLSSFENSVVDNVNKELINCLHG